MSRSVVVRPLAEQDLFQAQAWYDDKSNGLGTEFRGAVDALFQQSGYPLRASDPYMLWSKDLARRTMSWYGVGIIVAACCIRR